MSTSLQNPPAPSHTVWPWLVVIVVHGLLALLFLLLSVGALWLPGRSLSSHRWFSEDQIFALVLLGLMTLHLLVCWGLVRHKSWAVVFSVSLHLVFVVGFVSIAQSGATFFSENTHVFSQELSIVGWLWAGAILYGLQAGLVLLGWISIPPKIR